MIGVGDQSGNQAYQSVRVRRHGQRSAWVSSRSISVTGRVAAAAAACATRFAAELAYPVQALVHYQGAYAIATANVFTADGSDGHFTWATQQLTRPMMNTVLDL